MIKSRYSAAITDKPWWLAGGIPREACVAAYQPVGASDYAASKVNLANPGVYDAVAVATKSEPAWSTSGGWYRSNDTTTEMLNTTVIPSYGYSIFIRFTGTGNDTAAGDALFGGSDTPNKYFEIYSRRGSIGDDHVYFYGNSASITGERLTGSHTIGMTKEAAYLDGVLDILITTTFEGSTGFPIYLFTTNRDGTAVVLNNSYVGYIKAVVIYSTTLTADQVAALTNAMNVL